MGERTRTLVGSRNPTGIRMVREDYRIQRGEDMQLWKECFPIAYSDSHQLQDWRTSGLIDLWAIKKETLKFERLLKRGGRDSLRTFLVLNY